MNSTQISSYWQAYLDLIEIWAKGIWDEADIAAHFIEHGEKEGRRISDAKDAPSDWSDWLYFQNSNDPFRWWWQKGVIESGVFAALIEGDAAMQRGCVSQNSHLQKMASMSSNALRQLSENAQDHPGAGPLSAIAHENMQWGAQKSIGLLPVSDAIRQQFSENYGYVIVVPWLESGGAELVGLWHYLAAKSLGLNPLMLLADKPNMTERFLAHNVKTLNLPEFYQSVTGQEYSNLTAADRAEIFTAAIDVLQPDTMHLIHAFIGYTALSNKNTKSRIRAACKNIYVSAFCPHIHSPGNYDGYFRYIPEITDIVDKFVFDNDWYLQEMRQMYQVTPHKMTALKYPIDAISAIKPKKVSKPKVLWASRFDSQKNPQIVAQIAARMPDIDFVMYGRRVLGDVEINWEQMPKNVIDGGEFFSIDALPLHECYAFLYTSKFDGTPNILMEIASRGLPIVTPNIGGISGFLGKNWPAYVTDPEDIDGYVTHLNALNDDRDLSEKLTATQSKILKSERSFEVFEKAVKALITAS